MTFQRTASQVSGIMSEDILVKDRSTAQSVIFLAPRKAVCATTRKDILKIVHFEVMSQGAQLDDLILVDVFVLGPKMELVIRYLSSRKVFPSKVRCCYVITDDHQISDIKIDRI